MYNKNFFFYQFFRFIMPPEKITRYHTSLFKFVKHRTGSGKADASIPLKSEFKFDE